MKAMLYATRDRKNKKREFRALWIARINAASRQHDMPYNRFISGLQAAGVDDRPEDARRSRGAGQCGVCRDGRDGEEAPAAVCSLVRREARYGRAGHDHERS